MELKFVVVVAMSLLSCYSKLYLSGIEIEDVNKTKEIRIANSKLYLSGIEIGYKNWKELCAGAPNCTLVELKYN